VCLNIEREGQLWKGGCGRVKAIVADS